MEVRRVRADDWEALRDTRLRALADAPDAFGTTHASALARPDTWWRDWALLSATAETQAMFLAWGERGSVGIAGAFVDEGRLRVISMWTEPSSRGLGVARALLDAVVSFGGDREIVLGVTEGNDAARRLYERYGFVGTGESEPLRPGSPLAVHELRLAR